MSQSTYRNAGTFDEVPISYCPYSDKQRGLSFAELKSQFLLDRSTGVLFRISNYREYPPRWEGAREYNQIRIDGWNHYQHVLVWALVNGRWPPAGFEIDHIDRDARNNHWRNLRLLTRSQNIRNRAPNPRTGLYRVSPQGNGWRASTGAGSEMFRTPTVYDIELAALLADILAIKEHGVDDVTREQLNTSSFALFISSTLSDDLQAASAEAVHMWSEGYVFDNGEIC